MSQSHAPSPASDASGEGPGGVRLPRVLGPWAALSTIVGSVIGSGIFIVPARVAHEVPAIGPIVIAWILGGLFSLAGALTLAELAAMLPHAGGPYVYLKAAFGRLPAFLFGWTEFLVIRSGSVATLAAAFALYASQLWRPAGLDPRLWQTALAVAAMVTVAGVNILGTRWGGRVQVVGTVLKVGALGTMIALPWLLGRAQTANLAPLWPDASLGWGPLFRGFMVGMVGVLWAYDGWVNTANLAEEIEDPSRSIPRALIGGVLLLIALYLGTTLAYHLVLPMPEIASASTEQGSPRAVSADFCQRLLGEPGLVLIALTVMTSTFISLNGNALSGPRAYFALARDGLFPAWLCRVHPTFKTPAAAIAAQTVWSLTLTLLGTAMTFTARTGPGLPPPKPLYDVLYTYVIFGATIFYTLSIVSVFVLRRRQPDLPRPYRTFGYPITPIIFVVGALILLGSMLVETPVESLAGLGIVALGLPAYALFRRNAPAGIAA